MGRMDALADFTDHLMIVLVCNCREQNRDLVFFRKIACRADKLCNAVLVVRAVDNDARRSHFHTARPFDLRKAFRKHILRNVVHVLQNMHRVERKACIHHLVFCHVRNRKLCFFAARVCKGKGDALTALCFHLIERRLHRPCRASHLFRLCGNDRSRTWLAGVVDHRDTGFDDAGFLSRNRLEGVAKILGMVAADGRDDACQRLFDHICRIQPSAKAGLHDQIFHAGFFENQHSHQEQRLKIARMAFALRLVFFGCFFHFEKCVKKLLIRHIFPVDLEPLVDAYKVRGGKKSCLFAACKQHRIQVRADASLSVRARHMDNFDPFLRIPKARKKLPRMFRRMLHRKFRYCFDIINCFCIIHFISPFFSILGLLSNPSIIIIE